MATLTISREHRDAIYEEIASLMHAGGDLWKYLEAPERDDSREWICEFAGLLAAAVRLLDQLGWQAESAEDVYVLELSESVAWFMEHVERRAKGGLEDGRKSLIRGRDDHLSDEEWGQVMRDARRMIDLDLDAIDVARLVRETYGRVVS